jgi:hypothetical protein
MIRNILAGLFLTALPLAMAGFYLPDLMEDWRHKDAVVPSGAGEMKDGRCTSKLIVTWCDVKLSRDNTVQERGLLFVDFSFGDHEANVWEGSDGYLTTSLAMEKLINRTITLALLVAMFAAMGAAVAFAAWKEARNPVA